tara:strand:- start:4667 stop:5599 length:933 start_codon:yes stop_codon:yes gene_type:complete
MKLSIIVILLFSSLIVKAQDYNEYYNGINNAKLMISQDSLKTSLSYYFQTFEKFDFVFARDCYNAIELSALAKDSIKLEYFIKRGIKQGLNFNYVLKMKNVSQFQNTTFIKKIEKEKDRLENIYTNSINWELRNEVIEMFEQDQIIREKYYEAILFKRKKIGREWEALNKIQVERIIEITKKHGFPGEKIIGIDTKKMHFKIRDNDLSAGMPIVIFIHHFSQPNKSYDSILKNEIQSGKLSNEHYAIICDFQYTYCKKIGTSPCYSIRFRPKESKEQIDINRLEIGLLSLSNTDKLQSRKYITPFWRRLY